MTLRVINLLKSDKTNDHLHSYWMKYIIVQLHHRSQLSFLQHHRFWQTFGLSLTSYEQKYVGDYEPLPPTQHVMHLFEDGMKTEKLIKESPNLQICADCF